jgi:YesN/AraC family two-component response regulator
VLEASNGEEAMQILKENRVDLVITDWIMPVMDGAALIKTIREDQQFITLPILLLTAKDEIGDWQEALDLGADQVIPKPFNLQLLLSQVKRIIETSRIRARKYSTSSNENLVEVHRTREAQYMAEVERIIRDNIKDPGLNAESIARALGVSRTSLFAKIKSITGQTLGEYIQRLRLKQAIQYMLYEQVSVTEVYIMVGFSSSSYMIRLFKKFYNTTPGEYVKNYLKTTSN